MSDFYEDDEDPADVRAAFDRGPHGVTGSSGGARLICGNGFATGGYIDAHKDCRAALDAAQDEIEKLLSINGSHRSAVDLVRDLHQKVDADDEPWWCEHCISAVGGFVDWPCDTIRRLDDALGGGV